MLPLLLALLLALTTAAHAFIDVSFTPVRLVAGSETILVGTLSPRGTDDWAFDADEALKGRAVPGTTITLAGLAGEQGESARRLLAQNGKAPALLFVVRGVKDVQVFLHVAGAWLSLKPAGRGRWAADSFAVKMSGVFAGGTDALTRMVGYILADPEASVPVSVGTTWMADPCRLGRAEGEIGGMEAVAPFPDGAACVFVASSKGDRLYRAKTKDEAFDDVTATSHLDTCSRRFVWADLDADGRPELVSWDGAVLTARTPGPDGTFARSPSGPDMPLAECLGLAALSAPGEQAAILVSTTGAPSLLSRDAAGKWSARPLPEEETAAAAGPAQTACVVADLDNDGFCDVLQPRRDGGILWRGGAKGFAVPVASPVASPDGPGRFCLGDFNHDGFLDLFLSGPDRCELWENDGKGGFRGVVGGSGSLSYKAAGGASDCRAADLNHDGRTDLCLLYPNANMAYHFNRGFRCFGEEGELGVSGNPGAEGQLASCVADFNGDASLDLAVAFVDGEVCCYYNDSFSKPILRPALAKGAPGPVTVTVWQGEKAPFCMGALSLGPGSPAGACSPRGAGTCTLRWRAPGGPERQKEVAIPKEWPGGGLAVEIGP